MNIQTIFKVVVLNLIKTHTINYGVILKKYYPFIYEKISQYKQDKLVQCKKFSTKVYWWLYNISEFPKCKTCGKLIIKDISSIKDGLIYHCSRSCAIKDIEVQTRTQNTSIKKYGVKRPMQNQFVKTKVQETCIKKYGVKNPFQSKKLKRK